ncbi:hypothetical protein TNCV_1459241 [Trichonephila clavipes]|nr:hypothetical protein TNCV_1459241 [Trichonephila clavipes]
MGLTPSGIVWIVNDLNNQCYNSKMLGLKDVPFLRGLGDALRVLTSLDKQDVLSLQIPRHLKTSIYETGCLHSPAIMINEVNLNYRGPVRLDAKLG